MNEIEMVFMPAAPEESALTAATVYFNRLDSEHKYTLIKQKENDQDFAAIVKQVVDGNEIKMISAMDVEHLKSLEHIGELWEIERFVRCILDGTEYI